MKIVLATIGAPRDRALAATIREYEARAARYFQLEVIEVPTSRATGASAAEVRRREGEALLTRLPDRLHRIALTRDGSRSSSSELAERLREMGTYGLPGAVFVLGGAFGLAADVLRTADETMRLSTFTFPHEIARLVLAEQIYRAGTIIRGEPYHKGTRP